ncbi:ubiquitin carboxyl-terminal hydrolase isozyme L5 isoform X2 [Epargyreus clarus]
MEAGGGSWSLIESDPGVFSALVKKLGVIGIQVEELWSMDDEVLNKLKPVHGLIFLFKFLHDGEPQLPVVTDKAVLDKIYFAKQVINNACATQAVISILMNCRHSDVDIGPELTKLQEFSRSFDPYMRGLALSNSQTIREAHNSVAPGQFFEFETKAKASDDEDAYHFVAYVPIEGRVYELDGLREGPIDHGPIGQSEDWLHVVRPIIMRRINAYTEGEIHFNLMAVISDQRMILERQLHELHCGSGILTLSAEEFEKENHRLTSLMSLENYKLLCYRQEMKRRKHNYMPFIVNLLKLLAKDQKLSILYEDAKSHVSENINAMKMRA